MLNKLVAVLTTLCFIFSSILTQPLRAISMAGPGPVLPAVLQEDPFIPSNCGAITEEKYFGSKQVVINIQDLHCHTEVQMNISKIIENLDKKYHLDNIFVEGGYGTVDTSPLCKIDDKKMQRTIVQGLMEQGKLTGTEYYSVTANRPYFLKGIEDPELHKSNIVRLGQIIDRKERFEENLRQLSNDLERMKAKYFESKNRRFEDVVEKYHTGEIDAARYYLLLDKYVRTIHGDPASYNAVSSVDMHDYPTITSYLAVLSHAKRLNYSRIGRDLSRFIAVLKSRISYKEYAELITKSNNFTDTDVLFASLSRIARVYSLPVSSDLREMFIYTEKKQSVNPLKLIAEERKLVAAIRVSLSSNVSELEVSFLTDFYIYFKDYLLNKLSVEDYAYFCEKFDTFKLVWGKYANKNHVLDLAADFPLLDKFYQVNMQRNDTFVKKIFPSLIPVNDSARNLQSPAVADERAAIVDTLNNGGQPIVIVAGGFHTEGLKKLLEQRRISYMTIMPMVTQDTHLSDKTYSEFAMEQAKILANALHLGFALQLQNPELIKLEIEAVQRQFMENNNQPFDRATFSKLIKALYDSTGYMAQLSSFNDTTREKTAVLTVNGAKYVFTSTDHGPIGVTYDFSQRVLKSVHESITITLGELYRTLKIESEAAQDVLAPVSLSLDMYNLLKKMMQFAEEHNIDMSDVGNSFFSQTANNSDVAQTLDGLKTEDLPEWARPIFADHEARVVAVQRSQLLKILFAADFLNITLLAVPTKPSPVSTQKVSELRDLIHRAMFGSETEQTQARAQIEEMAQSSGLVLASTYDIYQRIASGEIKEFRIGAGIDV
ncbi:MAG: hypothetical protein ABSH12_02435 [Endomicrobiales bacterium]